MSSGKEILRVSGREIGIVILVVVQSLIGIIHVLSGSWLLSLSNINYVYSLYTAIFGVFTLLFAFGLWNRRSYGWIGTFATLLFVTVADVLTIIDLPSIPGISKLAGAAEIAYSVIVLFYLVQPHVRAQMLTADSGKSIRLFSRKERQERLVEKKQQQTLYQAQQA